MKDLIKHIERLIEAELLKAGDLYAMGRASAFKHALTLINIELSTEQPKQSGWHYIKDKDYPVDHGIVYVKCDQDGMSFFTQGFTWDLDKIKSTSGRILHNAVAWHELPKWEEG